MKALSIRQPWAWLVVQGYKDIENRTWSTGQRGEILIHASKTIDREAMEVVEQALAEQSIPLPPALETGGIVGAVTITDCITDSDSPWFDGPFGFVLTNAKTLTFKPLRGRLGLFETSLELSDF